MQPELEIYAAGARGNGRNVRRATDSRVSPALNARNVCSYASSMRHKRKTYGPYEL